MIEMLSNHWMHALGWTFLHSLWQGAVIFLGVFLALRLVPERHSGVRYGIAVTGLIFVVAAATLTFSYQGTPGLQIEALPGSTLAMDLTQDASQGAVPFSLSEVARMVAATIDVNIHWILGLWAAGFMFFSMRLSAGLYYTWRLRSSALSIDNGWSSSINDAARKMGINRFVSLAEVPSITSPVVVGYMKPVILIPMGMLTGLTTEQLETIFLHELAHIRRHDYLVNVMQSAVETFFFFNPFVWFLSRIIRREREYCCDDVVIRWHGGSKAYAHALTKLAEARLAVPDFALPLANSKNQLLNRIKRIMETSVEKSGKKRFALPVLLLVGALLCISWLGMDPDLQANETDTVPANKAIAPLLQEPSDILPDMPLRIPLSPDLDVSVWHDTIPPVFGFKGDKEWRAFAESMRAQIRENFQRMETDSLFLQRFADHWQSFEIPQQALRALERFEQAEAFKHMEEELQRLQQFDFHRFRNLEKEFAWGYEDALRDQLIEDGYLKESEAIESLEWSNDSFKVNGKSIDRKDREKYRKLNDTFFNK